MNTGHDEGGHIDGWKVQAPSGRIGGGVQPGSGLLVQANAIGYSFRLPSQRASFSHPFTVATGSGSGSSIARVSRGLVEDFEPSIGDVLISGGLNGTPPSLQLDPQIANDNGESFICLEVVPEKDGTITAKTSLQIAHRTISISTDPNLGRCALAMVIWNGNHAVRAQQIIWFNLRYDRVIPAAGGGAVKHYFR